MEILLLQAQWPSWPLSWSPLSPPQWRKPYKQQLQQRRLRPHHLLPSGTVCSRSCRAFEEKHSSVENLLEILEISTVQQTVDRVIESVIWPHDTTGYQSENTFMSVAIPLSNQMPERVKKQIWANEFVDFALLLPSSPNDTGRGPLYT